MKNKRGIFFSADALIAVIIVLIVIVIIIPITNFSRPATEIHRDVIRSLSSLKIGEINNSYVKSLIASGEITNLNNTILEQIGEFYVTNITLARSLAESVLSGIQTNQNFGIWYQNKLIASVNKTPIETAENIETARQIVSGIGCETVEECESTTGFSARAFLSSTSQSRHFYLGGYVGDGNLSANIEYYGNISSAEMELAINDNFNLYINNILIGSYAKSPSDFTPALYPIPITEFRSGNNTLEFRGRNLHIPGGFIKITYDSSSILEKSSRYYFPGVNGVINIYDGFYIPGNLTSMDIFLHLKSPYISFLTIGNTTIFRNVTQGEQTITLSNSQLSSQLDYNSLAKKTIPLRFGLENVSYILGISKFADVFSVTDLSGSMVGAKMAGAKQANRVLIDTILNLSGNKVGLVGYETLAYNSDFHNLSNNNLSLNNIVSNVWDANGYTCICCGINKAIQNFAPASSNSLLQNQSILYYDFENNALDKSGNGFDGTLVNNPIWVAGINGNAIQFNALDDGNDNNDPKVNVGISLDISALPFAMSAWINPVNYNDYRAIFSKRDSYSNSNMRVDIGLSSGSGQVYITAAPALLQFSYAPPLNTWTHIAVVAESTGTKLYVNGNLQQTLSAITLGTDATANVAIGGTGEINGDNDPFNGMIDDFRLYNRALSQTEIDGLRNQAPVCNNNIIEIGEVCDSNSRFCTSYGGTQSCNSLCNGWDNCILPEGICGNGVLNNGEQCDDGNTNDGDGCSSLCQIEPRLKSMIVMSDGFANRACGMDPVPDHDLDGDTTNDEQDHAIEAACNAKQDYNITVHAVGFGSDVEESTLQDISSCGGGAYYFGNVSDIVNIYKQLAEFIIQAAYVEQTINATGNISTILYPDSRINFNYQQEITPYGLVLTVEKQFSDDVSGTFDIPANSTILETVITSYSGARWTDNVEINNNTVYKITDYGQSYINIGDPYHINIPNSLIQPANVVELTTGISPSNSTSGSQSNKIIYKVAKEISTYSDISLNIDGCMWHIEFEDNTNITVSIPLSYIGSNECYYTSSLQQYDINDATQNAVNDLLKILDLNGNGKVEAKFTQQDLQIELTALTGIPFTWSTEVQVRTWY